MTDVCHPKKSRLATSADVAATGGNAEAAARLLRELTQKCSCTQCGKLVSAGPMLARCGHCLCEACAAELRGGDATGAAAAAAAASVQCRACGQAIRGDELKTDAATGKLLNAMQVLQDHMRQQLSQPSLERARCADCLGRSSSTADEVDADDAGAGNRGGAVKRCEDLRGRLDQLAEAGDRDDVERRRLLDAAVEDLDAWRDRMSRQLGERHAAATLELQQVRQRAERLLLEEAARSAETRACADELRRLLQAEAAPAASAASPTPALQAGEARASALLARLTAAGAGGPGSFELSRRADPDTLAAGFAALLAQAGVDLVVRPYGAAALGPPELRPARIHRTGGLEPWDFGLLTNVRGLWYTPDGGEVRTLPEGADAPEPDWLPLSGPCLIANYKSFKTKRLHLFDAELKEVARIRPQLKEGRLPGTIYVWNERQVIFTVDHSKCKVCQFDMTGRLIRKLGSSGSGPSQFRQPMSVCVHAGLLYVVDSDNKRVQMFDVESQEPRGSLKHEGFSTDLHSVLVTDARILVTDRDNAKVFVFDRGSRLLLREVALSGKPFSLTEDAEGNVFVSLTNERKVDIYDASLGHRLHSLTVARSQRRAAGATSADDPAEAEAEADEEEEDSSSSDGGVGGLLSGGLLAGLKLGGGARGKPPFIYGIAWDAAGRRLFVADTFCHAILAYQL